VSIVEYIVRQTLFVCFAHSAWARLAWFWSVDTIVVATVVVLVAVLVEVLMLVAVLVDPLEPVVPI
jgi:hypothetical protein